MIFVGPWTRKSKMDVSFRKVVRDIRKVKHTRGKHPKVTLVKSQAEVQANSSQFQKAWDLDAGA